MTNRYFDLTENEIKQASSHIKKTCDIALSLNLTNDHTSNINNICTSNFLDRMFYTKSVSWALFTKEWIDEISKKIPLGAKVLEVCAGKGILMGEMTSRGIDWTCTDLLPPEGCDHVIKMDAIQACILYKPDIVFASWIPYNDELDWELATTYPCIFVGEGYGGCTGSERFWDEEENYIITYPDKSFNDVPQWAGIHDSTFFTIPKNFPSDFWCIKKND